MNTNHSTKKDIIHEIKFILGVFREMFKEDKKTVKNIDKFYEEQLIKTIESLPIPDDAVQATCDGIYAFKCFVKSIHFDEFKRYLGTATFKISLDTDVYQTVLNLVMKIKDTIIKNFLVSLMKKCKPIFDCFTVLVRDPLKYVEFLATFERKNEIDSIFE